MTNQEFSDSFTTLLNSYRAVYPYGTDEHPQDIVLDEYEKSVFLTLAQNQIVVNLYNGKNAYNDSFESSEEIRRYLNGLVETKKYDVSEAVENNNPLVEGSKTFNIDDKVLAITLEQIKYTAEENGCYNGKTANVYPVSHDSFSVVKDNPFRGPTKYKAIRVDTGNKQVEIISKFPIQEYLIKYIRLPQPIILVELDEPLNIQGFINKTECELPEAMHNTILNTAVTMALTTRATAQSDKK